MSLFHHSVNDLWNGCLFSDFLSSFMLSPFLAFSFYCHISPSLSFSFLRFLSLSICLSEWRWGNDHLEHSYFLWTNSFHFHFFHIHTRVLICDIFISIHLYLQHNALYRSYCCHRYHFLACYVAVLHSWCKAIYATHSYNLTVSAFVLCPFPSFPSSVMHS